MTCQEAVRSDAPSTRTVGTRCVSETDAAQQIRTILAAVETNPVFMALPQAELERLAAVSAMEKMPARTRVHRAGEAVADLLILVDGVIRVYQADGKGRQVTVKHLRSPNSLFEMELLTGVASLGSAETLSPITLVRVPSDEFNRLIRDNDDFCRAVLGEVCNRLCVATRHSRAVLFDVECRLASLLVAYVEFFGKPIDGGTRINLKLTQDDLASGIGVVVRSVSRMLAVWKRHGWVSIRKGWYVIHNLEALQEATRGFRFNLNHYNVMPEGGH